MTTRRTLGVAMAGIGVGGTEMLPAFEQMEEIDLIAGADINPLTRERFQARYEAKAYASIEELCEDDDVEAVWISTPNRFHAPMTIYALEHGKHVVVEKPMALNLEEAQAMCDAAKRTGNVLIAGHTRSFIPPFRKMYSIIESGQLGAVKAINFMAYTDWLLRPRVSEELDLAQGGGLVYRQGPHQIDTVRLLGGGMVKNVRGVVGQWMPERPIPGYYSALFEFENGAVSTIIHNAHGYFMGAQLVPWGHDRQRYDEAERILVRDGMITGTRDEESDKQAIRIGGEREVEVFKREGQNRDPGGEPWVPAEPGFVVVSCERGDITRSAYGITIYDNEGHHTIDLKPPSGWAMNRRAELKELYDAVVNGAPVYHTPEWGMATLEATLAVIESGKTGKMIELQHQVPVHPQYANAKIFDQLPSEAGVLVA
ncbi:MAG: Gfo/Idh/MocA family oxidoreductase [Chloroflexi bacterium]|nr:Gfo/Idh/MocA family oxidoreductase [Chloroflexota bacterium]